MAAMPPANIDIAAALADAEAAYRARNPRSWAQHQAAAEALPGGNTRTSIHVDPFPICIGHAEGARLWDLDGHEYVDFLSEFTAGIYGHSHPRIRAAIEAALRDGLNFGAQSRLEAEFAAAIRAHFPSIELLRLTNSGTEANLMAVCAARAVTGREKILVFDGAYHGSVFFFRGQPSPINAPFQFLVGEYNNRAQVETLAGPHRGDLAAILVEPMLGSGGCIPAEPEFLAGLRDLADATGAVLIFDEVMTSRLAPGGLQQALGVRPDLTTLGKYVGGGMSFGAFGGRAEIMAHFDPRRPDALPHAGTFNNNPLTMAAGLAGFEIYTPERNRALNDWGDRLRQRLNASVDRLPMQFTGRGSMIGVHMTGAKLRSAADMKKGHGALRDLFYFDLTAHGIWFAKRGFMALSLALDEADADRLAAAVEEFVETRAPLFAGLE
jgi:glutamate-1-semialdehyde 2,1-aminomutase